MDFKPRLFVMSYKYYELDPETGKYVNQKHPSITKTAEEYEEMKANYRNNLREVIELNRREREARSRDPSFMRFNEEYEAFMAQRAPSRDFLDELAKVEGKCVELENMIAERRSRMTGEELAKELEREEIHKQTKAKYEAILARMRNPGN